MIGGGDLHRLLYVSTLAPAAAANLESTVQDILIQSTCNNQRDGLSGFLLCDGVGFAQALEGPRQPLQACLDRIATDPRHGHMTIRMLEPAPERRFARWSMCGLTLSAADDAILQPSHLIFDMRAVAPGAVWQQLWSLAWRHARELDEQHARLLAGMLF